MKRTKARRLNDVDLDAVHGGARIGEGEGWGDWFRRQVPFGDWRSEDQKLRDFKAWDDWNRANGLPGAFGEEPRLKGNEFFLNPKPVTQDNPFGVFPEELQGLKDLRDGPPDGSRHPLHPQTQRDLDEFIKDAEQQRDGLDVQSQGRPGFNPDKGLPPDASMRVEAPFDTSTTLASASATFEPSFNEASSTEASYSEPAYSEPSYSEPSSEPDASAYEYAAAAETAVEDGVAT